MKKIISVILVTLLAISCLAACGRKAPVDQPANTLKFGMGTSSAYGKMADADGDTNGSSTISTTVAAVLLDADGKIVKCAVDAIDGKVEYTSNGELVAVNEYKSKGELGTDYGMSKIGKIEWNEQAANFCKFVEGKTLDQIKAYVVAEDGKGSTDVINAGCTIIISDFVKAIEKAYSAAADSNATANDTLKIGIVGKQEKGKNAADDNDGSCNVVFNASAVVTNTDKKVVAIKTDVTDVTVSFTADGSAKTDTSKAITTKGEKGKDYNMATYGKSQDRNGDGVVKEWNEQATILDNACIGLTSTEIAALVVEGYGVSSVQTAGCTIAISDMVNAIVKAAN